MTELTIAPKLAQLQCIGVLAIVEWVPFAKSPLKQKKEDSSFRQIELASPWCFYLVILSGA